MGRTKGALNIKVHAAANARSRTDAIALSDGNEADVSQKSSRSACQVEGILIADKAYNSSTLRQTASAN